MVEESVHNMSQETAYTAYTVTEETADATIEAIEVAASPRHRYQVYMKVSRSLLSQ